MTAGAVAFGFAPARAASDVEILISEAGARGEGDGTLIDLRLLNGGSAPAIVTLPERVEARLRHGGGERTVWLARTRDTPPDISIPPGGFVRARYRLSQPADPDDSGATIFVPEWGLQRVAIDARPARPALASAPPISMPLPSTEQAESITSPSDRSAGNAFLDNLSAYEPIYAVYGPGTNSEARIQVSFKYRLFGMCRDK